MRPRCYSDFWILFAWGLCTLSPVWADREPAERDIPTAADELDMAGWLRLKETDRAAIVEQYATTKPTIRYITTAEKQRQAALAAD